MCHAILSCKVPPTHNRIIRYSEQERGMAVCHSDYRIFDPLGRSERLVPCAVPYIDLSQISADSSNNRLHHRSSPVTISSCLPCSFYSSSLWSLEYCFHGDRKPVNSFPSQWGGPDLAFRQSGSFRYPPKLSVSLGQGIYSYKVLGSTGGEHINLRPYQQSHHNTVILLHSFCENSESTILVPLNPCALGIPSRGLNIKSASDILKDQRAPISLYLLYSQSFRLTSPSPDLELLSQRY